MAKVIILPGYSPHNKDRALEIKKYFDKNSNLETFIHEWRHWSEDKSMSIPWEAEKVKSEIERESRVFIIAKSVGTRVLMTISSRDKNFSNQKIKKVILCGIPTKLDNKETRNLYLSGLKNLNLKNSIIFQNKKDPFASFDLISKFITSEKFDLKVIEGDRSDHHYPYYEEFLKFLTS